MVASLLPQGGEEAASSRAAPTSSALVPPKFWRAQQDLYKRSVPLYFKFELPPAQETPTRDGRYVESGSVVRLPLGWEVPSGREGGAIPPAAVHAYFALTQAETWRAPWGASPSGAGGGNKPPKNSTRGGRQMEAPGMISLSLLQGEKEAASSRAVSTSSALVTAGFWHAHRNLYRGSVSFYLKFECIPAHDAPTRDGRNVESGHVVVVLPFDWKGPSREEGTVNHSAEVQASSALIHIKTWRAPWGASPSSGKVGGLTKELTLPRPPAAISGIIARVQKQDVNFTSLSYRLVGSLAACALALILLVCRRRSLEKRRGVLVRRRLRVLTQAACDIQSRRRGTIAINKYREQKNAAIILHALGRGGLVRRRRLHLLEQVVRVQAHGRGRVTLRGYHQHKRVFIVIHAVARGFLVRRRRLRLLEQVVRIQARRRGRLATVKYRQQQRFFVVLHALGRGLLARIRFRRSRAAAAAAMTPIASCDAVHQCPSVPAAGKGDAGPLPLDKGPGVPGQASGKRVSSCPAPPPASIPGDKARFTPNKGRREPEQELGLNVTSSTPSPASTPDTKATVKPGSKAAPKKAKKTPRNSKREAKRQADTAAKIRLGIQTKKGGSTAKTDPTRPDGASALSPDVGATPEAAKGAPGSTNSGSSPASTPIRPANSMAQSGCGASGAASSGARGSGVPGLPRPGKASYSTNSAAASVRNAGVSTWGKAISSNSKAAGVRGVGTSTSKKRSWTNPSVAGPQTAGGTGKGSSSWSPSEPPPDPAGLSNKNFLCAINTAVHVLRNIPALRKALMGIGGDPPREKSLGARLGKMFQRMQEKGGSCFVHPNVVTDISRTFGLTGTQQADVGEILLYLICILEGEAKEAGNAAILAALSGMTGATHYADHCSCSRKSESDDVFKLLPVPMGQLPSHDVSSAPQSGRGENKGKGAGGDAVNLTDLLTKEFSTSMVDTCEDCNKTRGGKCIAGGKTRSPTLANSPARLMLQLGRFSGDNFEKRKKLTRMVNVPTVLDVGPHTAAGRASGAEVLYDIDTVVHHTSLDRQPGDVEEQTGHYKVFTRIRDDTWYKLNDLEVSVVHTSDVLTKDAFILSYAKKSL